MHRDAGGWLEGAGAGKVGFGGLEERWEGLSLGVDGLLEGWRGRVGGLDLEGWRDLSSGSARMAQG